MGVGTGDIAKPLEPGRDQDAVLARAAQQLQKRLEASLKLNTLLVRFES
jgi:hypothetical protein